MSIAPWWCGIIIRAKSRSASPLYCTCIAACMRAIACSIDARNPPESPASRAAAATKVARSRLIDAISFTLSAGAQPDRRLRSESGRRPGHHCAQGGHMTRYALFVRLQARAGKEAEVEKFLPGALPLAQQGQRTPAWFALKFGKGEFGIFGAFPDEDARKAPLEGPIAGALMKNADALLAKPPSIERVDLLASKVPG